MNKNAQETSVLQAQNIIIEMITTGQSLLHVLERITYIIEGLIPNAFCSIHIFNEEEQTLENCIAPSLKGEYIDSINEIKISNVGSCGSVAFLKETVIVEDIENDPLWKEYSSLALTFGLSACWSKPIFSSNEETLGTFALYFKEPRKPNLNEQQIFETIAQLVALAIEREKVEQESQQNEANNNLIADNVTDFVGIVDKNGAFEYTSPSHEKFLDYSPHDLKNKIWLDYVHPNDQHIAEQAFNQMVRTNEKQKVIFRFKHKQGYWMPLEGECTPIIESNGIASRYIYIARDVTEKRKSEQKIYHLAFYDTLTHLPNHALFQEHITEVLEGAKQKKSFLALMYIDLNRFQYINDTFGLDIGDDLLKLIAKRLTTHHNSVYRISGDEFVIILSDTTQKKVEYIAEHLLEVFEESFRLGHHQVYMDISIGISMYPDQGNKVDSLMKNAQTAVHYSKKNQKSHYQFFTNEMSHEMNKQMELEQNLHMALEKKEFVVYYQPQVNIHTGELIGSEALVRWNSAELGIVSPGHFIPIAEETGLIIPIDNWVLSEACKQQKKWLNKGYPLKTVSVNMSVQQFYQGNLVSNVAQVLRETGVDPHYLILEITESVVMEKTDVATRKLKQLRAMGIKIALDDFGTGYSSLNYLKDLPIDIVKIDKSFMQDMDTDPKAVDILNTIILLTKQLGLTSLVEGIETEKQLRFLEEYQTLEGQGFLFSAPVPSHEFQQILERRK